MVKAVHKVDRTDKAMSKAPHLTKIVDKKILRVKAVLAVKVGNMEARTVQVMVKEALVVKVVLPVINSVANKVDLMAKTMVKVVLPVIMEPLQTSKTVAGTAVHLIKAVNANLLAFIPF